MLKESFRIEDDEEVGVGETAALLASPAETAAEWRARASLYRLLAGAFVEEVSPSFLAAFRQDDLLAQLAACDIHFDMDFTATPDNELLEILAVEYTALFASSGGFPPVESARLYGLLRQEPAFATMETYRRFGFELQPGQHEVFPDQIGVELLFIAELLERGANALDAGDLAAQRKLEKEIKRFWVQHLGRWLRGYARLIEQAAAHSFYREMARFLHGFAEEEIQAMGLRVEDADQARRVVPKAEVKVEFNPDEPVCNACVGEAVAQQKVTVQPLHDLR
jgi:TorA maturation chaperone TorD